VADYEVRLTRAARKDLESLDGSVVRHIFPKIVALAWRPRPSGCVKLTDEENLRRIRIGGHRVIYEIDDATEIVRVVYVRHRSNAYK
jgi:mRNA interferase RelE/StbE